MNELNNKIFELLNRYHKTGNETDEIKSLIEQGADVNAKDESGWTALKYACGEYDSDKLGNGNLELARFLISKGADVNAKDKDGGDALINAAVNGNIEIAKLLIKHGAEVNSKDRIGFTPLMATQFAISENQNGALQIAKLLIENHADVDMRDNSGRTALDYQKDKQEQYKNEKMIELLKDTSTNKLFEMLESYMCNEEIEIRDAILGHIKESLANGADINCVKDCQEEHINEEDGSIGYKTLYGAYSAYNPNLESVTPLMVAVTHNEYDLSKFLIENGANVNIKNKEGKTALDLVVESHKTTLISGKSYPLKDNVELKNLIISKGGKRGIECELDISETQQEDTESNIRRRI